MKIFIIPNPYDYHGMGEFLVLAKTKAEAIKKLKLSKHAEFDYSFTPNFKEIREFKKDIYRNDGCDC